MVVLVTGGSGQLGQAFQSVDNQYAKINVHFFYSSELDITDLEHCKSIFKEVKPNFCINAAAYTAVDKAEVEPEKVRLINVEGPINLAQVCKEMDVILLYISTDFIFTELQQSLILKKIFQIQREFTDKQNWKEKKQYNLF
jgi:dTDP-4-dehydrorhamnose reductase